MTVRIAIIFRPLRRHSSTLAVSRYGVNLGASGTDDLLGAVLVDVKGFSEQDEDSQDLQLEARVAGSRTCSLVKVTVCCSLSPDFSLVC